MFLGIGDFLLPGHPPLPGRGNDLQVRGKCENAHVEPHLVVPLSGAAVSHRHSALLPGSIHHQFYDEGASQCRRQRILPLIESTCFQGGKNEVLDKKPAGIDNQGLHCPCVKRLLLDSGQVPLASHIHHEGDDIHVIIFHEPPDGHRRIKSATVSEHYLICHF